MRVAVHDIRKSKGLSTDFDFEGVYKLPGITLAGPMKLHLKLTNAGSRILVEGTLRAPLVLECSRCAESFEYTLETDVEEHFLPTGSDEATASPAGVLDGIFTFENDRVELDELLRQEIEAALPMQAVCSEDCRGLCGGCGANLNRDECRCGHEESDPRWAGLKAIQEKSKN